jgi:hypothetical protein
MITVFLSASVPDPKREPEYARTADRIAIRDAARALAAVVLPRGRLIWGGHPAITPLIRVVAEGIGITSADRVLLYQSAFFEGKIPKDNAAFERVVLTRAVEGDRQKSLEAMREAMLTDHAFDAGVFIGGMSGVIEEYHFFHRHHPSAVVLPIASTGAAAHEIFHSERDRYPRELATDLAYPSLFRRFLPQGAQ